MRLQVHWLALLGLLAVGVCPFVSVPGHHPTSAVLAASDDPPARDVVVVRRHTSGAAVFAQSSRPPTLDEMGFETLPVPEGMTTEEFMAELEADPTIRSIEPDAIVRAANEPNDPYYPQQVAALESVNIPASWELANGREEIVVAVLDTGIDLNHPDLASRLWVNAGEVPNNGIDNDGNGCIDDVHGCRFVRVTDENAAVCGYQQIPGGPRGNVNDDHHFEGDSHGTLVSGLLGAAGNNGLGLTGVAWNIRIMPVKVLDCMRSGRTPELAQAIEYARQNGAHIINLSLAVDPAQPGANNSMVRAAIAAAEADGVIVVAASGNIGGGGSTNVGYPAANSPTFSNLVAVGASSWQNGHTWQIHSRYGPEVDFAAPDTPLITTSRSDLSPENPYVLTGRGTSFSTPLVSGMFALMMSANPRLGHHAYIEMARSAASPAPAAPHGQNWAGWGIIDVRGAVEQVPMLITGAPLHDWVDVPAGTVVQARINGTSCGQTESISVGPAARFELIVAAHAVVPGCGNPGDQVEIYIDGAPGDRTFAWAGATGQLLHTGQEVSSVSPPPGSQVAQPVQPGWNNVGHFASNTSISNGLSYLPASWEALYKWVPRSFGARYLHAFPGIPDWARTWENVSRYDAYWVHLPSSATLTTPNPNAPPGRVINLDAGWNNFVYTGTSAQMATALQGIAGKYVSVHRFDNESGAWLQHFPGAPRFSNSLGGLLHARIYWIYMAEPAALTMN